MQLYVNDTGKQNNEDKSMSFVIGHVKQLESKEKYIILTERQVQPANLWWDLSNQAFFWESIKKDQPNQYQIKWAYNEKRKLEAKTHLIPTQ